jgi:hypothetical protein
VLNQLRRIRHSAEAASATCQIKNQEVSMPRTAQWGSSLLN